MGKRNWSLVAAAAIGIAVAIPLHAQQGGGTHEMSGAHGAMPMASNAMTAAMDKMNRDMMAQPVTGDTDRDFVAMMIPHHQGAIDMARAELATGRDPEMRKLAEDIIKAQESEIREMREWQSRHKSP